MPTPKEVVSAFVANFSRGNAGMYEAIRVYFLPDTIWENVGLAVTTSVDEAIGLIAQFESAMDIHAIDIEILAIAEDGNCVLTERIDRMLRADGSEIWAPRVMGIFEVEGDHIAAWRDYFDSAAAQSYLAGN